MRLYWYILLIVAITGCSFSPLKSARNVECFRNTPVYDLALAVQKEDTIEIEQILNNRDIDINYENKVWNQSVLEFAVLTDKQISVVYLLKKGADPFLNSKRETAISLAAETNNYKCIKTILNNSNIDSIPIKVVDFVLFDAYNNSDELFNLLIENNVHLKDTIGASIYSSVYFMDYDYALELLKCGVVFNDSVAYDCPYLLNGEAPQTISYLLLNKKGYNFNSTPEFIVERKRDNLIDYLDKKNLLKE